MTPIPTDFPWRPGMNTLQHGVPARLVGQDSSGRWNAWDRSGVWLRYASMDGIEPDPTDPATIGALLGAVREAYPEWPVVCLVYRGSTESWQAVGRHRERERRHNMTTLGDGPSEFAALLAAWNDRPKEKP